MEARPLIPIFVINLDRRPDRLAVLADQLRALNLPWMRVSAFDMETIDEQVLGKRIALSGHKIQMGRGSQCCALTNLAIYRRMIDEDRPAALILQDDAELSSDLVPYLASMDWLPEGVNVVQFEKYGRPSSKRLLGPELEDATLAGRALHRLHSRTAGAACYLITQDGARIVSNYRGLIDMPIDHFLFSPNVSPVFDDLKVAVVRPALARQRDEVESPSDLTSERRKQNKSLISRVKRLWQDLNQLPKQLLLMSRGARWMDFGYDGSSRRGS
ncbi:glycosyltransferase family 25 protein [Sedimentimonas flavescens]|uniref:glycosyltransferase family 25 protein n=1 Tax=Sedimentimonas flavescens TaxID=2851012 RepID=UPI0021A5B62A|nr:glycosyltransferase family 25 protein [Sedimentimonas flavescens]MCT2541238.1 glycosyltransferase family 25 protein [Sedimentimonas flavescens]